MVGGCLLFSAVFSGIEMAFVSCNRLRLHHQAQQGNEPARIVVQLLAIPQQVLASILIGNNVALVAATSVFAYWFERSWGIDNEIAVTCLLAPVIIIFADMIPKDYCRQRATGVITAVGWPLTWYTRIVGQLSYLFTALAQRLLRLDKGTAKRRPFVTEEEFRFLIDEGVSRGVLQDYERQLVDRILNFERMRVQELITPVANAAKIELTQKVSDLKALVRKTQTRHVLVYEEDPRVIVGLILAFDVLFETDETLGLSRFLRAPLFLPTDTTVEEAFLTLQANHRSLACVTNRDGEVVGVVTVEDLVAF